MARSIGVFFLLSLPLSLCLRITSPMAPACRILTSPMSAAEPYEGAGFNRKIRRRPLRRAAETPYDRPAAAIQGLRIQSAAAVAERNGWISKIFQPAMRIIARSASHIFPSMFQTPLPPPSEAAAGMTDPCTDENHHSCKGFSEVACTNPSPKIWEPCSSDAVNLVNNSSPDGARRILNSDANGISELEILLKQKTFTRMILISVMMILPKHSLWYESVIVQEMLTLIIQIVQERRYCGFSATENLRRELVYMHSTRSQLVKSLPRDVSKNGGQLQNVLNMLAVYSNPFGLNQQGKYSLRKAHWKELDPDGPLGIYSWQRNDISGSAKFLLPMFRDLDGRGSLNI